MKSTIFKYALFFFLVLCIPACNVDKNDDIITRNQSSNTPFQNFGPNSFQNFRPNLKLIPNIAYGTDVQNTLDLYIPKKIFNHSKALIYLHGGGWKSGDKSEFATPARVFLDSGIVCASVNYRYANYKKGILINDLLSDIDNSIRFLKIYGKKIGCSFDTITLMGGSAGGHLTLLYAYKYHNIQNAVSLAGPTNLLDARLYHESSVDVNDLVHNLTGSILNTEIWANASPYYNYTNTTTYLYHGKLDIVVPYSQSVELYEKIKDLNPKNRLVLYDDSGHGFSTNSYAQTYDEVIKLIKSN